VPIQQEDPGLPERLTQGLPVQLQGVVNEMMWSSFASQINVQLAREHEEIQKTARWARPLKSLGMLCSTMSWIPFAIIGLSGGDPDWRYIGLIVICGCVIHGLAGKCLARATQTAQAASTPVFEGLCQQWRASIPIVSLNVMSMQDGAGTKRGRYVEYRIAGAPGGGMALAPNVTMEPGTVVNPGMHAGQMGAAHPLLAGAQPGMTQPGMMQPNIMHPGMTQPGMMQPFQMESQPRMMVPSAPPTAVLV